MNLSRCYPLLSVFMLLLSDGAWAVQEEDLQYSTYKEGKMLVEAPSYSNATANVARRHSINTSLRSYAFHRILRARSRTGLIYNVSLGPSPSLHGISCQIMRLRAGSLRRRGLTFNNFHIPKGALVHTGGPFVLMIYKNIPLNSTHSLLYSLPPGYTYISPIVGIFIYTSLTATSFNENSSEMNLLSPTISISIPIHKPYLHSPIIRPLCAFFDINGTLSISNLSSPPNICSSSSLMDTAIVLSNSSPLPSSPSPSSIPSFPASPKSKESSTKAWRVALIAVLASFSGVAIMGATVLVGMRVQDKAKILNEPADNQEILQTSVIGHLRAPTASGVRTKPTLETESLR